MSKNNKRDEKQRFSIRKFSVGTFSILIGVVFAQPVISNSIGHMVYAETSTNAEQAEADPLKPNDGNGNRSTAPNFNGMPESDKPTGMYGNLVKEVDSFDGWYPENAQKITLGKGSIDKNEVGFYLGKQNRFDNQDESHSDGVYKDFDVTSGSEFILKYYAASTGAVYGFSNYTVEVKEITDSNLGRTLGTFTGVGAYTGNHGDHWTHEFIVNIPTDVKKVRVIFRSKGQSRFQEPQGVNGPIYSILLRDIETKSGSYVESTGRYDTTVFENPNSQSDSIMTGLNKDNSLVEKKVKFTGFEIINNTGGNALTGLVVTFILPDGLEFSESNDPKLATFNEQTRLVTINDVFTLQPNVGGGSVSEKVILKIPKTADKIYTLTDFKVYYKTYGQLIKSDENPEGQRSGLIDLIDGTTKIKVSTDKSELQEQLNQVSQFVKDEHSPGLWKKVEDLKVEVQKIVDDTNDPETTKYRQETINSKTLELKKINAKLEIDKKEKEKKTAIERNIRLTNEEKNKQKEELSNELKFAYEKIDRASNDSEINKVKEDTLGVVATYPKNGEKKPAANKAIDDAVTAAKQEIAATNLSPEDKQRLNDQVEAAAQVAKEAITAGDSNDKVDEEQAKGIAAIELVAEKGKAKAELKEAADIAKENIDAENGLTNEEKVAQKAAIDGEVTKANQAIDEATTKDAVDTAKNKGLTEVNAYPKPEKKPAENQMINNESVKQIHKKATVDTSNSKEYTGVFAIAAMIFGFIVSKRKKRNK